VCAHADTNYYVTLGVVSHVLKCLTMVGEGVGLMKIRHAMTSNEGGGGLMKVRHGMTSNEGRGLFLPQGIREPNQVHLTIVNTTERALQKFVV
jgi:hypothetical protein